MRRFGYRLAVVVGVAVGAAASAGAQEISMAERGPRFLVSAPAGPVAVDVDRTPVLRRRITLDLRDVTLGAALDAIARESGLRLGYSRAVVPVDRVVRLVAEDITVAGALSEVLFDSGVDVLFERDGQAAIVRRDAGPERAQGVVTGRVTDAKTGEALVGSEVLLEGTRWRTGTGANGRYRLTEVAPGSYTLAVRRIGYGRRTQPVTVMDGQETTVDVALEPVPTRLDEVVTTVTGEQRIRELGHVVGRINADSVVKAAPVSSLSQLLNGRVPGLQVFTNSGVVGGKATLQLRSPNSVLLGVEPIVIIDGVRYTTAATGWTGPSNAVEETSRLNDLNPNDIESVEVVKGPSAATLYGTDASNGVIVITTKRGRAGATRWNAYVRAMETAIPKHQYDDSYWGWGTVFGRPSSPFSSCTLALLASGRCTQQDSVVVLPNPLNDPDYTIFHGQPSWQYGLNAGGGREDFKYYFSADYEDATGPFRMPREAIERIKAARGVSELPDDQLNPNVATRLNLRASATASLSSTAEIRLTTGYINGATRTISSTNGPFNGASTSRPGLPYGMLDDPASDFSSVTTEHLDRFVASASAQWRPAAWLQGRGTVGFDIADVKRYSLTRRGEVSDPFLGTGRADDYRQKQLAVTGDIGLSALLRRGRVSFRTAVGAQYARSLTDILLGIGFGLPPGGESPGQASTQLLSQDHRETVALGSYIEETVGLNERLFLTGALRVDGASAFGRDYAAAMYPKAGVSWIASEEPFMPRIPGLDELRLRYAFGASGQQGRSLMALPDYRAYGGSLDGGTTNVISLIGLGNPNLKPERVREHEIGLDLGAANGRGRLALTWFKRRTVDPIVTRDLAPGFGTIYTNFGLITGHGFEGELSVRPIESHAVTWQLSLTHALHRSKLVDLGGLTPSMSSTGSYVEGYPLGSRFSQGILGYDDANGDGIIVADEIQMSDQLYAGESTPPIVQTLATSFGLFAQRLRISALFERRTGFTQINQQLITRCFSGCREQVDVNTSLADQAKVGAIQYFNNAYRPIESGSYTRFRELTAAVEVPDRWARAVRIHSASLSFSARNVALWSSFSGPDPESAPVNGYMGATASGVPQGRSYVVRLDLQW